jgi:hypothetical protein
MGALDAAGYSAAEAAELQFTDYRADAFWCCFDRKLVGPQVKHNQF